MQTAPPLLRMCGIQNPACMHCLWEMWVLQFSVHLVISHAPRKAWHKSMCLQLTGVRHCNLTWCTALTGPYLDAATLCLPGMLCLGQDRGHSVGGVLALSNEVLMKSILLQDVSPDSAHFCNALLLLRLIDSPSKMSLFTIQPGQCCFPL